MSNVYLDGTTLEGGGQLVRNALALSSLTRTPIHITSIRGNRSDGGGLKAQHLSALDWLARATGAVVEGAHRRSKEVVFKPGDGVRVDLNGGMGGRREVEIDVGSPGSVFLVFQAVLPVLIFGGMGEEPLTLIIRGGTTVSHSPSHAYVAQVLIPTLSRIGLPPITVSHPNHNNLINTVTFTITPLPLGASLPVFSLTDRGEVSSVDVTIVAPSEAMRRVMEGEVCGALREWGKEFEIRLFGEEEEREDGSEEAESHKNKNNNKNNILYILLVLHTTTSQILATDSLLTLPNPSKRKNVPNRHNLRATALTAFTTKTAKALKREWDRGGCVDYRMRDQLVVFQGLASGRCRVDGGGGGGEIEDGDDDGDYDGGGSMHTKTSRWVLSQLLGVKWDGEGNCEGVGWKSGERWRGRLVGESGGAVGDEQVKKATRKKVAAAVVKNKAREKGKGRGEGWGKGKGKGRVVAGGLCTSGEEDDDYEVDYEEDGVLGRATKGKGGGDGDCEFVEAVDALSI